MRQTLAESSGGTRNVNCGVAHLTNALLPNIAAIKVVVARIIAIRHVLQLTRIRIGRPERWLARKRVAKDLKAFQDSDGMHRWTFADKSILENRVIVEIWSILNIWSRTLQNK